MYNSHWAHICQPDSRYLIYHSVPQPTETGIRLSTWPTLCGAPGSLSAQHLAVTQKTLQVIYDLYADNHASQPQFWDKHLKTPSHQILGDRVGVFSEEYVDE